jgi:hypothetical protein
MIASTVARTVVYLTTVAAVRGPICSRVSVLGPGFIAVGPVISGITVAGGIGAATVAGYAVVGASHYCSRQEKTQNQ